MTSLIHLLTQPLEPQKEAGPAGKLVALEALRGWAALAVLLSHALGIYAIETDISSCAWNQIGRCSVLIFFVLSGYVIGLTNRKPWTKATVLDYLKRRALRLLPIYYAAIIITVLLFPSSPKREIVGAFLFLGNLDPYGSFQIYPLLANPVIWTLNQEVLFYLLFLAIWKWRPRVLTVAALTILLAATQLLLQKNLFFVSSFACGFLFWVSGLFLAWNQKPDQLSETIPAKPWISWFLLGIPTLLFSPTQLLISKLNLWPKNQEGYIMMNLHHLDMLPLTVLMVSAAVFHANSRDKRLEILAWLVPLPGLFLWGTRISEGLPYFIKAGMLGFLLALCFRLWKLPAGWTEKCAWLGGISYGLYLLHFPILTFMHQQSSSCSTPILFLSLIPALLLIFAGAWLLEKPYQNFWRYKLFPSLLKK